MHGNLKKNQKTIQEGRQFEGKENKKSIDQKCGEGGQESEKRSGLESRSQIGMEKRRKMITTKTQRQKNKKQKNSNTVHQNFNRIIRILK